MVLATELGWWLAGERRGMADLCLVRRRGWHPRGWPVASPGQALEEEY